MRRIQHHDDGASFSRESSRTLSPEPKSVETVVPSLRISRLPENISGSSYIQPSIKSSFRIQKPTPFPAITSTRNNQSSDQRVNAGVIDLTEVPQNTRKRSEGDVEVSIAMLSNKRMRKDTDFGINIIDDSEEEAIALPEIIDLEKFDEDEMAKVMFRPSRKRKVIPKRNERLTNFTRPWQLIQSCKFEGYTLTPKKVVEYSASGAEYDSDRREKNTPAFLVIKDIIFNIDTRETKLRGYKAVRTTELGGKLETGLGTKNELCLIHEVDLDDTRSMLEQSVYQVALTDVLNLRLVSMTNKSRQDAPELRYSRSDLPGYVVTTEDANQWFAAYGRMCIRWAFIKVFENATERLGHNKRPNNCVSWTLRKLKDDECQKANFQSVEHQRRNWQKDIQVLEQTSLELREIERAEFDLGRSFRSLSVSREVTKYTFSDIFCGGGGATSGARSAGLMPIYGVDNWEPACDVYKTNNPRVRMLRMDVHEFSTQKHDWNVYTDVAHISPPCQYFSPNHTRERGACPNDDSNYAASFCVIELLKKIKPRFVTSEQTFGILHSEFTQAFSIFISQFTDIGYSVTWRVVRFERYGLPQRRHRLLLMAAAPGETLPEWPPYTHSEYPCTGAKPFTTVKEVFENVRRNAPNHKEQVVVAQRNLERRGRCFPTWDDSTPFLYTICTQGIRREKPLPKEQLGHPRGGRDLTSSELGALQGLSPSYILPLLERPHMSNVRRIVGNMFPPSMAKVLLTAVREHMEASDQKHHSGASGI